MSLRRSSFDEYNTPYDMQLLDAMKDSEVIILHAHSEKLGAELLLDRIRKYRVNALNWWDKGTTLTLHKAKSELSKTFSLVAGIDHAGTLLTSPEEVDREVKEAVQVAAPDGGFILGPGCVMSVSTPEQNIRAALEAALKYGKY